MRQRKIKNLEQKLAAFSDLTVEDPSGFAGSWRRAFGGERGGAVLAAEIGCGKGKFVRGMALAHPDWDFVAVEGHRSVALHALEKARDARIVNVRFVLSYVRTTEDLFAENELDRLYLNFSDPWPKARHAKRRLTYHTFLESYARVLRPGGVLQLRTDNTGLFEFSLGEIAANPRMYLCGCTRDLHADPQNTQEMPREDRIITTEYEDKFVDQGKSICQLRVKILK